MRLNHTWPALAMLLLFSATTTSAQTAGTVRPDLGNLPTPGMTVWITGLQRPGAKGSHSRCVWGCGHDQR